MTTLVIVSEDAEPSGLTHHLLDLVGWVRAHRPEVAVHVVLLRGGPLVHRLHALAPTTVVAWDDPRSGNQAAVHLLRSRPGRRVLALLVDRAGGAILRRRLPQMRADVTYLNGLAAVEASPALQGPGSVALVRLPDVTEARVRRLPERARRRLGRTGPVFVASSGAGRLLGATVAPDQIVVHPREVPAAGPHPRPTPSGATVVGGWGPPGWASGADLFVRVAWSVRRHAPDLEAVFGWGGCSRHDFEAIASRAAALGLPGGIEWMGDGDVLGALDRLGVFVATDRDRERAGNDLLAATAVPVVSFDAADGAGGAGHHRAVAYGDVEAMAREVIDLCGDRGPTGLGTAPDATGGPDQRGDATGTTAPMVWAQIERCLA